SRFPFRKCFLRGHKTIASEIIVSVGQTRVSERVIWISLNRLREALEGLPKSFFRALVPEIAALKVKVISFGVIGMAFSQSLLVFAGQLQPQFLRYLTCNLL